MTKKAEDISYEQALAKLEESVRHLEKGDLTLEDSLKAFEEGVRWSRVCGEKLEEAKGKVEKLVKNAEGGIEAKEFDTKDV